MTEEADNLKEAKKSKGKKGGKGKGKNSEGGSDARLEEPTDSEGPSKEKGKASRGLRAEGQAKGKKASA